MRLYIFEHPLETDEISERPSEDLLGAVCVRTLFEALSRAAFLNVHSESLLCICFLISERE
jgi:hypothetical protein